jgi:hypothetical protein
MRNFTIEDMTTQEAREAFITFEQLSERIKWLEEDIEYCKNEILSVVNNTICKLGSIDNETYEERKKTNRSLRHMYRKLKQLYDDIQKLSAESNRLADLSSRAYMVCDSNFIDNEKIKLRKQKYDEEIKNSIIGSLDNLSL